MCGEDPEGWPKVCLRSSGCLLPLKMKDWALSPEGTTESPDVDTRHT